MKDGNQVYPSVQKTAAEKLKTSDAYNTGMPGQFHRLLQTSDMR